MDADLKWIIGIGVTIALALVGMIVGAFGRLTGRINTVQKDVNERIDGVKDNIDDVKEKYVRRDDLDGHLKRLDESLKETRAEMAANHRQLLAAVTQKEPTKE